MQDLSSALFLHFTQILRTGQEPLFWFLLSMARMKWLNLYPTLHSEKADIKVD